MTRRLAAGNWKMNGTRASLSEIEALTAAHPAPEVDILICPPATLLAQAASLAAGSAVTIGAQDCHAAPSGAHTGDLSAPMLADAGATAVILGHSERRENHLETNELVSDKARTAQAAGLISVVCLGETLAQRDAGQASAAVVRQLTGSVPDAADAENVLVAYEPLWAIGTGRTAEPAAIAEMHGVIRESLAGRFADGAGIAILYGGSVKADNAGPIMALADVDGVLVGGASLDAAHFDAIYSAGQGSAA